jgi:cytochrome c nitrite reductase small subunit
MNTKKTSKNSILTLIRHLIPPDKWKVPVIILLGIFFGLGSYSLYVSNAISYISDDPITCVNCHIMSPQYATWAHGSHGRVATCNDCHVPHDNIFRKYFFKAKDGLRHATIFTMRAEPQVIQIKEAGKEAVQENCIRCHSNLIQPIATRAINNDHIMSKTNDYCWRCHRETPHGRVNSLASTPYARVSILSPIAPQWLRKYTGIDK